MRVLFSCGCDECGKSDNIVAFEASAHTFDEEIDFFICASCLKKALTLLEGGEKNAKS
jgi:hypothetical protein